MRCKLVAVRQLTPCLHASVRIKALNDAAAIYQAVTGKKKKSSVTLSRW